MKLFTNLSERERNHLSAIMTVTARIIEFVLLLLIYVYALNDSVNLTTLDCRFNHGILFLLLLGSECYMAKNVSFQRQWQRILFWEYDFLIYVALLGVAVSQLVIYINMGTAFVSAGDILVVQNIILLTTLLLCLRIRLLLIEYNNPLIRFFSVGIVAIVLLSIIWVSICNLDYLKNDIFMSANITKKSMDNEVINSDYAGWDRRKQLGSRKMQFPSNWVFERSSDCWHITDENGTVVGYLYFNGLLYQDDLQSWPCWESVFDSSQLLDIEVLERRKNVGSRVSKVYSTDSPDTIKGYLVDINYDPFSGYFFFPVIDGSSPIDYEVIEAIWYEVAYPRVLRLL